MASKDRRASACGSPTVVSLRLRSTFPFAEPLAEAELIQGRIKNQEVFVTVVDLARVVIERSRLLGQSFGRLVSAEFRPAFSAFLEQVFAGRIKQAGDFELACKDQPLRFVNIEAQCLLNGQECRAAVVDITARKVAEAARSRLEVMAASNRKLEQEIIRRKKLEEDLKISEHNYGNYPTKFCSRRKRNASASAANCMIPSCKLWWALVSIWRP